MDAYADLDYSDYYSDDAENFGLCDNTHLKEFGKKFLPTVYSIVTILGIVVNCGLIFIFIKYKDIRKILPLCMFTSDLLFGATLPLFAVYANCSQWIFGQSACKIATCLYSVTMYSSHFSLAFMSLEKYCSVVGGFCSVRIMKMSVKNIAAFLIWVFALLASVPQVYFVEAQEHDGHQICTHQHTAAWRTFMKLEENIVGFIVPLTIMCVCSGQIINYRIKRIQQQQQQTNNIRRVLRQEMPFVVMFFSLWLPYNVVVFLHVLQEFHILSDCTIHQNLHLAVMLTESLAYTHVFVNPLVYASLNKRIRKRYRIARADTVELIQSSSENHNAVELTAVHTTNSSN